MIKLLKQRTLRLAKGAWWHCYTLFACVRHLGIYTGTKYYNMSCQCRKNPAIIEDFASTCQAEAMNETDPALKAALQSWAFQLRENLRTHLASTTQDKTL